MPLTSITSWRCPICEGEIALVFPLSKFEYRRGRHFVTQKHQRAATEAVMRAEAEA